MNFILENWYLFLMAIVAGTLLFVPSLSKGSLGGLSPAEVVQKINKEKASIIDVRDAADYAASHITGAKNVALADVESQLGAAVKNKATQVIMVCESGGRAHRAAVTAKKLGYENAQVLAGGMKAWKTASLPVIEGKA